MIEFLSHKCPECSHPFDLGEQKNGIIHCKYCGTSFSIHKKPDGKEFLVRIISSADWTCPDCQKVNPRGTHFCTQCKHEIGRYCPNPDCRPTGKLIYTEDTFCPNCGANVKEWELSELKRKLANIKNEITIGKNKLAEMKSNLDHGKIINAQLLRMLKDNNLSWIWGFFVVGLIWAIGGVFRYLNQPAINNLFWNQCIPLMLLLGAGAYLLTKLVNYWVEEVNQRETEIQSQQNRLAVLEQEAANLRQQIPVKVDWKEMFRPIDYGSGSG